ncbi:MAG: PQQ-binding-like beta-propeller repeat protein [Clostridia bacterium]|nr:PQQ-binding-like beta-propeller repeat protein [Clostridia bacterium]
MNEYIAFISYRHMPLDTAVARRLHRLIERYRVPAKLAAGRQNRRLGRVFRDQDELPVSSDLSASIREALDHTRFLIVVCTPDTPKSVWVQREISYFLEHHSRDNVLVVLAAGRPEESFADQLVHIYDADGNLIGDTEPLAANIAGGGTHQVLRRLDSEKLRLFAALIGCSYDSLYQRERRYRFRQLAVASTVLLLAASTFIGMLLVKNRQITARNQQLIEQKQRIQLSESTLLTKNAEEALATGNDAGAIRSALSALPDGPEDDRPFYAPAERALLSALHVFEFSSLPVTLVAETEVSIASPVGDFAVDEAGEALYVADEYGGVTAFDPLSGAQLWRTSKGASLDSVYAKSNTRLLTAQGGLIQVCGSAVARLDQVTGEEQWQYSPVESTLDVFVSSLDGQHLALVCDELVVDEDSWGYCKEYRIDALDAQSGKKICTVPLATVDEDRTVGFRTPVYKTAHGELQAGLFTNGGKRFISTYDDGGTLVVYEADLEAQTCRTLASWPMDSYQEPVIGMCADPSEKSLYLFQRCKGSNVAATCVKFDLESGKELWRAQTPDEGSYCFNDSQIECCLLMAPSKLLFSAKDRLYALDMETGETVASVKLQASMAHMFSIDGELLFGFVLNDGYYAVGWLNDNGFFDSRSLFNYSFRLGELNLASSFGLGFIRPVIEEGKLTRFEAGDYRQGFGYIVLVPQDDDHSLRVKRALGADSIEGQLTLPFPQEDAYLESNDLPAVLFVKGGALLNARHYGENGTVRHCARLDTQTHEIVSQTDYLYSELAKSLLLSDGSGLIWMEYDGAMHLIDFESGADTVLAERQEMTLEPTEDHILILSVSSSHADYLTGDGRLLTAWCDGKALRWWLDGEEQSSVSLPEAANWYVLTSAGIVNQVLAGGNGLIVLSDYGKNTADQGMENFIAYDTRTGEWLAVADEAHGSAARMMAVGRERPLIAVLDADRSLRVYDLAQGALTALLPIDMPIEYVEQLQFAFGDRYLMLHMEDGQLALFDLETGEAVFHGLLEMDYTADTVIYQDSAAQRAYFIDRSSRKCLVVNMRQWELLAQLEDICGFDSERDELYTFSYGDGLQIRHIPDLDALIQSGRQLVNADADPFMDGP